MASDIQVYGTDWCGLTRQLREFLMTSRFEYDYFDIDHDDDAQQFVLTMNDGRRRFPIVVVKHRVVTEPTVEILKRVIREHGLQPAIRTARSIARHAEQDPGPPGFRRSRVVNDNSARRTRVGRRGRPQRKRE